MGVTVPDPAGIALTPEAHVSLRYDALPAGNCMVHASPVPQSRAYMLKVRV
jgi:hypothetical protein